MKKLFFIILQFLFIAAAAQEPLKPVLPEKDSVITGEEWQLTDNRLHTEKIFSLNPAELLLLPDFDFKKELASRWNHNVNGMSFYHRDTGISGFPFFPLTLNGVILSEGSYKVNDRLSIGGYSFAANRLFSLPAPALRNNNFDLRGSTLFLKYKISDKFRIETRFNITQDYGF